MTTPRQQQHRDRFGEQVQRAHVVRMLDRMLEAPPPRDVLDDGIAPDQLDDALRKARALICEGLPEWVLVIAKVKRPPTSRRRR
jgi:hypothetical protein